MKNDGLISLPVATAVGLGAIIGAGIFVLSGTAIALAGADSIIAFVVVGFVAIMVALELGELGSIMPKLQGAAYSYVYNAFGSELGFITGIMFYFSSATAISAISLGFGSYLGELLSIPSEYSVYLAIPLILVLAFLTTMGLKKAANADFVLVLIKLFALLIFIFFALSFAFGMGHFNLSNFGVSSAQSGVGPLASASVAIFFAYTGFQVISTITSRVRGGANAAAKAILLSVILSLVIYTAIVISLLLIVSSSEFTVSSADPISIALNAAGAPYALKIIIDIGALFATASATLAMFLMSSRTIHQLGIDGLLPKFIGKSDPRTGISRNGVLVTVAISIITLFSGNVYVIAAISVFGIMFAYLMSSFALIHFRKIKKVGSFKSPFYPYLPVVAIIFLLGFMLGMPDQSLAIGVVMIISLILIYYFLREYESKKIVKVRLFS